METNTEIEIAFLTARLSNVRVIKNYRFAKEVEVDAFLQLIEVCLTDPAHIARVGSASCGTEPKYILSRSWADRHLNSDADLQYFNGGAVIK